MFCRHLTQEAEEKENAADGSQNRCQKEKNGLCIVCFVIEQSGGEAAACEKNNA